MTHKTHVTDEELSDLEQMFDDTALSVWGEHIVNLDDSTLLTIWEVWQQNPDYSPEEVLEEVEEIQATALEEDEQWLTE